MGESSEVPIQASSPACYTIEDDDEPEVVYISHDDNLSEDDSRDGEPSSTTSDINGDGKQGNDFVNDEFAENGTNQEASESDAIDEDEISGNVLNDFIKLIDLVKSYEKVDRTVKTKFKDGFLFLENLQTQFEDTERNISEKDEIIEELIAENNKLKEDNKQLMGEMSTQSLQFGMLKNKYMKLEEELKSLKISEKVAREPSAPVIPMCTNISLETMKSKADKLQHFFRELCSKMSADGVVKIDTESVKRSKELKSFQNEVGVLFIKVQHKLSKWAKNQVKMGEELEHARLSLEQLKDMVSQSAKLPPATEEMTSTQVSCESNMETVPPSPTVAAVESSTKQPENRKRKLPPPPLVPLHFAIPKNIKCNSDIPVITIPQKDNSSSSVSVPNELSIIPSHLPALKSSTSPNETSVTNSTDFKSMTASIASLSPAVQPSPPQAMCIEPSPPPAVPKAPARPSVLTLRPSSKPMQSSLHVVLSPTLPEIKISESTRISPSVPSPSLYQLPPLPHLNFPLSPPKSVVSTLTPESSSEQVASPVCTVSTSSVESKSPKVQPSSETKLKGRRSRAKSLRTTSPQIPQTTVVESRYPFTPSQYSNVPHPQFNLYPVSQYAPNGPYQAALQAYQNQMMQVPFSTASHFVPQQQNQITSSSSAPPVSTQNNILPTSSISEIQKQIRITPQNKCQVCGMTFSTHVQLKLHHTVVHSNKTPSSALNGPVATSPPTSTISYLPNQQNMPSSSFYAPPSLRERHQNATSLQRVPSMGQTAVTTNIINGTTTCWSTTEHNQKRHCSGLSSLSPVVHSSSVPKSVPFPDINSMTNSVNSTQPNGNKNFFSWFDLF